jgi:hypothetical protein
MGQTCLRYPATIGTDDEDVKVESMYLMICMYLYVLVWTTYSNVVQ